MSARLVAGVLAFGVAMTAVFLGNLFLRKMIEEINRQRPEGDQVDYFWFTLPKSLRIFAEYRSLYPDGKYADHARAAIASAAVGMLVTAVCIGIIPLMS
jgi:hypothetical protein